jgi:DNA-binding response OmpR family regulator
MRLLVIEDETRIAELVKAGLGRAGFTVDVVGLCGDARAALAVTSYDAAIVDLGLPDGDGLELLRELRTCGNRTPILVLTARDAVEDRVCGLDTGADDYLVKPFAVQELIARLHALVRRGSEAMPLLSYADLTLDLRTRTVTRGAHSVELTGRETALLEVLLREPGRTVTRERAIEQIWDGAAEANVVDRYVTRLRRKLGSPPLIRTVRGTGFTVRA